MKKRNNRDQAVFNYTKQFDGADINAGNILVTEEEIAAADIVILAIDIKIADRDRFEGKRIIQVSTDVAIKSPNKLIEKAKQVVEAA